MTELRPNPALRNSRVAALEAIRRHFADYGRAPSYAELGARIGLAAQRIGAILRDLEASRYIALDHGRRGIHLLRQPLGEVATSELLLELQARGLAVRIVGEESPIANAWPVVTRTKCEVTIPEALKHIE